MAVMVFSAEEIVNRAIEIETKARDFYRKAATASDDQHIRSTFEILGGMEEGHVRAFQDLMKYLTDEEKGTELNDPGGEMLYYLEQFKEIKAWEMHSDINTPGKNATTRDIVKTAMNAEKETVFFYTFLYDYVPVERGLDKLLLIIQEERRHVAMLQNMLDELEAISS